MVITFKCRLDTEDGTEFWTGTITEFINHGSHYQLRIESRSGISVILGVSDNGNFACIPDWGAGCYLSALNDTFWNTEKLTKLLGLIDGITVASALASISDYI